MPHPLRDWKRDADRGGVSLAEVVRRVKPTILIGASSMAGSFTEEIVKQMAAHVERPISFILSAPPVRADVNPSDVILRTEERALIARGSPFSPVTYREAMWQPEYRRYRGFVRERPPEVGPSIALHWG